MDLLVQYALSFVGVPYRWGGSTPMSGLDCSGLVQLILKAAGEDPPDDQTAQALYIHFMKNGLIVPIGAGSLAFYGKDTRSVSHVAFCIDQYRVIEASGGNSRTRKIQDAIDHEAFVKVSLVDKRKDFLCTIKPQYKSIGGGLC